MRQWDGFDGTLRSIAHHIGVVNADVIVEAVADLILSLNGLNHVINAGAYPAFGSFVYYHPPVAGIMMTLIRLLPDCI